MGSPDALPPTLSRRLVVCAGVYRSGSTWAYNMVKAIINAAIPSARIAGRFAENVDEFDLSGTEHFDLVVLKAHPQPSLLSLIEFLEPPVILSVRDPRDCVASWLEMLGEEFDTFQPRLMRSCCAALRLVEHRNTLTVRYEDGATGNAQTLKSIADHLGLRIDQNSSAQLLARLSPEAVKEQIRSLASAGRLDAGARLIGDPQTLWLPAHVGDGKTGKYQQKLTVDQIRSVNCWARSYCEAFGYEIPAPAPIPRGNTVLGFGRDSDALTYLRAGFSYPEIGFTWTDGDVALIELPLAEAVENGLRCDFRYFTPRPPHAPPVKLAVMLLRQGAVIATAVDSGMGPPLQLEVTDTRLRGAHDLQFRIAVLNPYSPKAHKSTSDDRKLGMALQSIHISY